MFQNLSSAQFLLDDIIKNLRNLYTKVEMFYFVMIFLKINHLTSIFCRIRLKQNRYPALLLTQGINSKYDDYYDPRTWTIKNGSNFVAMSEILGVAAMADDIQRDPSQVFLVSRVFFQNQNFSFHFTSFFFQLFSGSTC